MFFKFLKNKNDEGQITQRFGVIKTKFIAYFSPLMFVIIAFCMAIFVLNFDQIKVNYQTNIPLNTLIFFVFFMAMITVTKINYNMFFVARFLKSLEKLIQSPVVGEADVKKLQYALETRAYMINTQYTFEMLESLQKYGHPMVTDKHAMLIKSKLGFRIKNQRGSVSFMAGILVMLGLIGTFWGLLLTIASVGSAMNTIADMASDLGGDGGGIGGIISSISAPLQGMGVAFSSSLFGLSGSLVVGFYNFAAGQSQDKAIEDFSRWIDTNIPDPALRAEHEKKYREKLVTQQVNMSEDVDAGSIMLTAQTPGNSKQNGGVGTGFVPQSIYSDDVMMQILTTLNQSKESNVALSNNFGKLLKIQKTIFDVLEGGQKKIDNVCDALHVSHDHDKKMFAVLIESQEISQQGFKDLHNDMASAISTLESANHYLSVFETNISSIGEVVGDMSAQISVVKDMIGDKETGLVQNGFKMISDQMVSIDNRLQSNLETMVAVVKDGNMNKMSKIVKEMQLAWLRMRVQTLNKKSED